MKREDKNAIIDQLTEEINQAKHFYITDIGGLDAGDTLAFRRLCFKEDVKLLVVKNTLLKKALDRAQGEYEELYPILNGPTSVMITETGNKPARMIQTFRKNHEKPVLKGAYVEQCVYTGENLVDKLITVKSREELIADVILILKSPMQNVLSQLNSGKHILAGVVKTLSDR
ncbi:MAG: 50S ribosomal protein L10 [Bacteroidetes bacterium GWF2_49_14]|nr:MAG: 50S ribosomal protein L10 [Bacteroidetes bacterium GWF2_49_14]HBB90562.1 50S ribosomal protein L10 [Bacteroidales bacterium]